MCKIWWNVRTKKYLRDLLGQWFSNFGCLSKYIFLNPTPTDLFIQYQFIDAHYVLGSGDIVVTKPKSFPSLNKW